VTELTPAELAVLIILTADQMSADTGMTKDEAISSMVRLLAVGMARLEERNGNIAIVQTERGNEYFKQHSKNLN
jgi:hypothetical protein